MADAYTFTSDTEMANAIKVLKIAFNLQGQQPLSFIDGAGMPPEMAEAFSGGITPISRALIDSSSPMSLIEYVDGAFSASDKYYESNQGNILDATRTNRNQYAFGLGNSGTFNYRRLYHMPRRQVINLATGFESIEYAKNEAYKEYQLKNLAGSMRRVWNAERYSALYNGQAWGITDGTLNDDGLGMKIAFHPNMLRCVASGGTASLGGLYIAVGTDKTTTLASEINTALLASGTATSTLSTYAHVMALVTAVVDNYGIIPFIGKDGWAHYRLMVDGITYNSLVNDSTIRGLFQTWQTGTGISFQKENPYMDLRNTIGFGNILIVRDNLACRGFNYSAAGTNDPFAGTNGWTALPTASASGSNTYVSGNRSVWLLGQKPLIGWMPQNLVSGSLKSADHHDAFQEFSMGYHYGFARQDTVGASDASNFWSIVTGSSTNSALTSNITAYNTSSVQILVATA